MWTILSQQSWLIILIESVIVFSAVFIYLIKRPLNSWYQSILFTIHLDAPYGLPLIGKVFGIVGNSDINRFGETIYNKFEPFLKAWVGVVPIISIIQPSHVYMLLNNSKLSEKNFFYSLMHTFIGDGLITSNGNKWKIHRRYISYYFNTQYLEHFVHTFDESTQFTIGQLQESKEIKMVKIVNNCVLTILHNTIMGIPITDQELIQNTPFSKGEVIVLKRVFQPWLLVDFFYKFTSLGKTEYSQKSNLQKFARKMLEKRRREKEANAKLDWCLLDGLIEISETKPDFDDEDIVNEVCTFMLAGQDSTGASTAFTLYYLAKHEDVQNKVIKEIEDNISNSPIVIADLNKLIYMEQCILEAMRLTPSIPLVFRRLLEDVKLDEYTLPKGCNICISPFATHRSPEHFPNPEAFDPERFSSKIDSSAYLPFSAGPRNCLGRKFAMLEMKIMILRLLQRFKLKVVPGKDQLQLFYRVTLRAKGGIPLQLVERSHDVK